MMDMCFLGVELKCDSSEWMCALWRELKNRLQAYHVGGRTGIKTTLQPECGFPGFGWGIGDKRRTKMVHKTPDVLPVCRTKYQ